MKIICTQENLKNGLSTTSRIISSSNTLPILGNILLKAENGVLKISSTNLEIAITTQIRGKIEEDGETTVNSKTLTDLINNMPNKNITLTTEKNELKIETENYHTNLKTTPPEEFPLIPKPEGGNKLELDAQEFKKTIDQVAYAASTNQTQQEICGIYLGSEKPGELKVAATDRYRLAEKTMGLKNNTFLNQVILPQKTIIETSRIIGAQKGPLDIVFNETQASITINDTQIISRLVDGQYPDYKQIIPANFQTTAVVEKNQLVSALKAASIFSRNTNSIKFEFSEKQQQLILTAESPDLGKSTVELPSKIDGVGGTIIFNHHYVLESLGSIESNNVIIKTIDDNSPGLVVPEGKNDYVYLVMPIKN